MTRVLSPYKRRAPRMTRAANEAIQRVEAAATRAAATVRCCARCTRRPYSETCGNPACKCH